MFSGIVITQRVLFSDLQKAAAFSLRPISKAFAVSELDLNYLLNADNADEIAANVAARKGIGNIKRALQLKRDLEAADASDQNYDKLLAELHEELLQMPNRTHPSVAHLKEEPKVAQIVGAKAVFDFKPREFDEITKRLNLVRTSQLGNVAGRKSYFLLGELAELEQALIKYTIDGLRQHNFSFVSVPDILSRDLIEGCGLNTKGSRTQVYTLDPKMHGPNLCLSGTSEMALAGYLLNKSLSECELPMKLAAVSRCYRAEVSSTAEERGIYRVHQFTKVEMFAASQPERSDEILEDFRVLQEQMFGSLGLHLRTLDMPPHELGAPAYRKYDVEAWLPGKHMFGEVSSCSNCTDFQSRRLGLKYKTGEAWRHVHTLNGTACAIPRMLIALVETYQTDKGRVLIPTALQKYMRNKEYIGRQTKVPELKLIKHKK